MKMTRRTLYDIASPICSKLKVFGFNFGEEKAEEGCCWKMYKWAVKCILAYQVWRLLMYECVTEATYNSGAIFFLNWNLLLISGISVHFFMVEEGKMERLMKRFKKHCVGKMSEISLKKQLIPFKIFSTLFAISIPVYSVILCGAFIYFSHSLISDDKMLFCVNFIHLVSTVSAICTLQLPILLCILPCIVARYCRAEMDEAIAEMKRIKSPLRRAKASAKLIEKYQQLYELASATDRALSSAMYSLKWPLLIAVATYLMSMFQPDAKLGGTLTGGILSILGGLCLSSSFLVYFPLLQYFYLAPSANQMSNLINRAMVEFLSADDQWLSRDPISRPYLLQMRMKQLEKLNHVAADEPPFTLFGDVIDKDISYVIILELIDMWNTLSAYGKEDQMAINRLFRTFMNRCIDCHYWNSYS